MLKKVVLFAVIVFILISGLLSVSGCKKAQAPPPTQPVPSPAPSPSPAPNRPPMVDAGPDREIWEGENLVLEAKASDPDNDHLDFGWFSSGGFLYNPTTPRPIFYAPWVEADTQFICTVVVSDRRGGQSSDTMRVTVRKRYIPPPPPIISVWVSPSAIYPGGHITIFGRVTVTPGWLRNPAVWLYLDGRYIGQAPIDYYGYFTFSYFPGLPPGFYTIRAEYHEGWGRGIATAYFYIISYSPPPYYSPSDSSPPPCPPPILPPPPPGPPVGPAPRPD